TAPASTAPGVSVVGKIRAAIASTNCAWRLLRACKRSPRSSRKDCDFSFMICTRIVRSYNGQKWHVKNLDAHTCCVARTVEAILREIIGPGVWAVLLIAKIQTNEVNNEACSTLLLAFHGLSLSRQGL